MQELQAVRPIVADRTDRAVALIAEALARWLAVDYQPDVRVYPSATERREAR